MTVSVSPESELVDLGDSKDQRCYPRLPGLAVEPLLNY
jgi:hypothetical protein